MPTNDLSSPFHVLIADDYFAFAQILAMGLESYSEGRLRCDLCDDGANALHRLRNEHYDILLTDLNMVPMNGLDLINEVRLDSNLRHLPTVVISGHLEPLEARRAIQFGVQAMLCKPASIRKVWVTVARVLRINLSGMGSEGDYRGGASLH